MCLILLAINSHPRYPLIIAANRDEFYARPTQPLHWWQEAPQLLGGRDREHGGTWLGIARDGRLAAVTNYREGGSNQLGRPSRGHLPLDYLLDRRPDWPTWLSENGSRFNGFNLLFGRWDALYWLSNRGSSAEPVLLGAGIHGLSNHLLDTPWPKVRRGKERLEQLVRHPQFEPHQLLDLLRDETPATDSELPATGIGPIWERLLSPIFIRSESYGTRASTVLLVEDQHQVKVIERSWTAAGHSSDRQQQFILQS